MTVQMDYLYSEEALLAPLIDWLVKRRWVRTDTTVVTEFPWNGRRVDLVTLTKSGICSAYELKLSRIPRVLEQSSLNGMSFDRSFIVTSSRPSPEHLAQAKTLGLGVVLLSPITGQTSLLLGAKLQDVVPTVRQRVRGRIVTGAGRPYVWQ